ncbi:restriction endonuclease subunit S [Klebsiella pneumoniae]|nr:restriction endonuclease subunit S [Klebsiella pneumoniae]MCQ1001620.1 restriction endonuclease subunit S [Klebsiella pneumoniae]MCQ1007047.1 restriction endonuclease subunit S [Klebsiella pneumoniae]
MAHDVPLGCAPDEYDDLISGTCSHLPKDSGVEWLGEIPTHWICTQVKYGYDITLGKMLQKNKSSSKDELKPYLKAQNIQPTGIDLSVVDNMWFSPDEKSKLLLKNNDVLISEGGDVGRSALWQGQLDECYIQNAINRARAINGNSPYFLNYWMIYLKSADFINTLCNKATIAHYTAEKVETSPLLLPDSDEQLHISLFLAHETAKIDNLIEKQQQLIELLKEKRQAVISHAVTKGLNPDVPMKDSGIEWLGEVPEHWVGSSLKYMAKVIDCKHITAEFSDVGIPVASISEVKSWFVDLSTAKLTNEKDYLLLIDGGRKPVCGDIIYSRNATVGEAAIVSDNMPDFAMGQDVCLIKTNQKVIPEFILYTLKSDIIAQQLNLAMIGSTFKRINVDDIREGANKFLI